LVDKVVDKLIDEIWGKWWSVPILFIISILIVIKSIVEILSLFSYTMLENGVTYSVPKIEGMVFSIIIVVCFLGLNIWNVLFVFSRNHIKRACRGKIGILINIDTDNKQIYKETQRKFGDEFKKNLVGKIESIPIPFSLNRRNYSSSKVVALLRKKHAILFLNIGINYDKNNNSIIYDMRVNGVIIHAEYKEKVEKEFQKIVNSALQKFSNIVFPSNEMVKRLRVTATGMSLACEYIIGLSLFLNGEFYKAEMIFSEVINSKSNNEQWNKVYSGIQRMRHEIFMIYAMIYMEKYQRRCDDENALDKANEMLEKAKLCSGMTYEYIVNKAYYYIARKHDSKKANELINLCKQRRYEPQIWRYSEAFLKAYDNKSAGTIISAYNTALRIPYNIPDLILFIESVLEREPNRVGLALAAGILYKSLGDQILAIESIRKYVEGAADRKKTIEILKKKNLYFGNNPIEQVS